MSTYINPYFMIINCNPITINSVIQLLIDKTVLLVLSISN